MREYGGTLRAVRTGPVSGLVGQVLLLTALTATVGLGPAGWVAGLASAAVVDVTLAHGLIRDPAERLGRLGDTCPGDAGARRRRTGCGLLRPRGAGGAARRPGRDGARARLRRRR